MNERLEKVRRLLELSKTNFAEKLGITQNTYTNYIKRTRQIPTDIAIKIQQTFNVSIDWLLTGKCEMFLDNNKIVIEENQKLTNIGESDEFTKQIVEDLKLLDRSSQKKIYLEILTKLKENEKI